MLMAEQPTSSSHIDEVPRQTASPVTKQRIFSMSPIKTHPQYPFLRIGLAYDLFPEWANYPDGVVDNDWHIVAGEKYLSGSYFRTEADALAAVERELFEPWNNDLVEEQIQLAQERADWALMRRLIAGMARVEGYQQAEKDISSRLGPLRAELERLACTAGMGPY